MVLLKTIVTSVGILWLAPAGASEVADSATATYAAAAAPKAGRVLSGSECRTNLEVSANGDTQILTCEGKIFSDVGSKCMCEVPGTHAYANGKITPMSVKLCTRLTNKITDLQKLIAGNVQQQTVAAAQLDQLQAKLAPLVEQMMNQARAIDAEDLNRFNQNVTSTPAQWRKLFKDIEQMNRSDYFNTQPADQALPALGVKDHFALSRMLGSGIDPLSGEGQTNIKNLLAMSDEEMPKKMQELFKDNLKIREATIAKDLQNEGPRTDYLIALAKNVSEDGTCQPDPEAQEACSKIKITPKTAKRLIQIAKLYAESFESNGVISEDSQSQIKRLTKRINQNCRPPEY